MSNNNTTVKQTYVCNGVANTYAIPFFFLAGEESVIKVYLVDIATQVATLLVITADYTLDSPATEVTTVLTYPVGKSILVKRESPLTQDSEFIQGPFPFEAVEEQFDRVVSMIQELDDKDAEYISLPDGSLLTNITLPIPEANKLIGWNATADGLENKDELDAINLQGQIDTLEPRVTANEADILTLQGNDTVQDADIDQAQADLVTLDGRMTSIEADYVTLGATMADFPADISDLQDQIDLLDDRSADVDQLLIDVADHEGRITVVEGNLSSLTTRVNQLEASKDISVFTGSQLIINNQAAPLAITGFDRDGDGTQLAEIVVQLDRRTDSEKRYSRVTLLLRWVEEDSLWYIARVNSVVVVGEPDGLDFTVVTTMPDKVGQVYYTSDSMAGANYSGVIKFLGKEIPSGV